MKNKNILIVAPHADDETFGLNGFIQRYSKDNDIHLLVLGVSHDDATYSLRKNALIDIYDNIKNLTLELWTCKVLEYYRNRNDIQNRLNYISGDFDIILIPNCNDLHQDHRLVNELCKIAFRPTRNETIEWLAEYNVPESEQFSTTLFDTFLKLTDEEYKNKQDACNKYTTEYIPTIDRFERFKTLYRKMI